MSSTNQGPEYLKAEKEYLNSSGNEDRMYWLEEMIKHCPKHKSSENMLAELRTRLKKLQQKIAKNKKKSGGKKGIRKNGFQFVLVGNTNAGKSSLLSLLTNAQPLTAAYRFTTRTPELGTFNYQGVSAQIVDLPSIGSEYFDNGLINTADCVMEVVSELNELDEIEKIVKRNKGKRIVVVTKSDLLTVHLLRKLEARIKSKRIHGVAVSTENNYGLDRLKGMMFEAMGVIRIFTKEPGKTKAEKPMVLNTGATVKDTAEHILKGLSSRVKETHLTGPSGKFPNQRVGLTHRLKDLDVVEFHTR